MVVEECDSERFAIASWDCLGFSHTRPLCQSYLHDVAALAWVVDCHDVHEQLADSAAQLADVLSMAESNNKPLLILCNKMDECESLAIADVVDRLDARQHARSRAVLAIGCSATRWKGIEAGFEWLDKTLDLKFAPKELEIVAY